MRLLAVRFTLDPWAENDRWVWSYQPLMASLLKSSASLIAVRFEWGDTLKITHSVCSLQPLMASLLMSSV